MNFVRQPKGSNLCGQSCVAMLCDITLEEACTLVRTRGATTTKHLKRALHAMGVRHGDKRVRGFPADDQTALLFWRSDEGAHWMVWHKKKYYDPAAGVFRKPPKHTQGARVTSYLPIWLTD